MNRLSFNEVEKTKVDIDADRAYHREVWMLRGVAGVNGCDAFGWQRVRGGLFFFSSRRRHTRLQGDWSSDVCSSDLDRKQERLEDPHLLLAGLGDLFLRAHVEVGVGAARDAVALPQQRVDLVFRFRSEERRVGKECRSRWSPYH